MSEYPWKIYKPGDVPAHYWEIHDSNGKHIAYFPKLIPEYQEQQKQHVHRIVDCVNACVDFPQDALDGGWTALGMSQYAKKIEDQNGELLTRLKEMTRIVEGFSYTTKLGNNQLARFIVAKALIAEIEAKS